MEAITTFAPAKINLALRVVGRRADGLHRLDSLVGFAGIGDRVTVRPGPALDLAVDGPQAGALGPDNLVLAAAAALRDRAGIRAGARISLYKTLPVAAGLGGGSADAAATLRGLCRLWNLQPGTGWLMRLARTLGADVPACLHGRTLRMRSTGDDLQTLPPLPPLGLVLLNPGRPLATAAIFAARQGPFGKPLPAPAGSGDTPWANLPAWLAAAGNDLLPAARATCPEIDTAMAILENLPAINYVGMSGSGATCFGLFDDAGTARRSATHLPKRIPPGWWYAATALVRCPD